ncbi:hypothetical protein THASP1DRAFT_33208 [Thamnocephalis sphaerospora]|uniref:Uncharacterized protein n=1 Tax=Thamnocephalis sphaerospora TaxID=78915 RepID=A0A4P9XH72_9FUNG|nr:hypothetical protein THASP1DRAFT_33208 [Thamnocephalis sphaerospora]|eukprot:RKP04968.1 hypothetical protein THASP1DRAFT_33208 [Thamnocephalis sphaerospora]
MPPFTRPRRSGERWVIPECLVCDVSALMPPPPDTARHHMLAAHSTPAFAHMENVATSDSAPESPPTSRRLRTLSDATAGERHRRAEHRLAMTAVDTPPLSTAAAAVMSDDEGPASLSYPASVRSVCGRLGTASNSSSATSLPSRPPFPRANGQLELAAGGGLAMRTRTPTDRLLRTLADAMRQAVSTGSSSDVHGSLDNRWGSSGQSSSGKEPALFLEEEEEEKSEYAHPLLHHSASYHPHLPPRQPPGSPSASSLVPGSLTGTAC